MALPFPSCLGEDENGQDETFPVCVYRDHPAWDQHSRWFMLPSPLLRELYVCTYDVQTPEQLAWVEKEHPGCIFVYLGPGNQS